MNYTYEHKSKTIFWDDLWKDQNIKGNEKLVLIYLIGHYNKKEGYAFPSINTIVTECGINKRTVIKVLGALEEKGYIKKVQSPKVKTDNGVQYQNNKYFVKCSEYMCYKKDSDSPLNNDVVANEEVKQPQEENVIDVVEGQEDITEGNLSSEGQETVAEDNGESIDTMYDMYADAYELAMEQGMGVIISQVTKFGIVEYANAHGLVIPQ